jgi:DNA-binding Lrp family transcriptional regulator
MNLRFGAQMTLDPLDLKLLAVLQDDASLSNAELAERIGLSASQCSRRRAGLEAAGYIRAYRADLDARKLGYSIEAFTRVTLSKHSDATAEDFAHFLDGLGEVLAAHSVAGDADYLLHIRVRSLDELGEFVLKRLLPHPHVHQVRSDIVLKTIKENRGFRIGAGAGVGKKLRRTSRS